MTTDKQSCADNMCGNFNRSAIWRRGLQAKYPNDLRIGKAVATLERLADETNDLTDEAWLELKPYYSWSSPTWSDAA